MDIVGRFYLVDGTELKVVTGIDDHSRYCVIAHLVPRATSRPVCDALLEGLARHGIPESILTDIQDDCALGSTVRPAGGGKLRGTGARSASLLTDRSV